MAKKRFTDQIRAAADNSSMSRYRIWQLTGISQATLSKFMSGKGGMSLEGLDALAKVLRLEVTVRNRKGK